MRHGDDRHLRLTIKTADQTKPGVIKLDGYAGRGMARLVEFDRSNSMPEIVLSFYSGGAHCCYGYRIFKFADGTWRELPLDDPGGPSGSGDGDGSDQIHDDDNDGIAEIFESDDSFLYKFTSYSGSYSPVRVYERDGGRWANVSREPAFRHLYAHSKKDLKEACGPQGSNSFWASYVAEQSIIGQLAPAWKLMLKCHSKTEDWGLCVAPDERDSCTQGTRPFPDVLREHLAAQGYLNTDKTLLRSDNKCREFLFPVSNGKVEKRWGPACTPKQCRKRACWRLGR
jgi:hypothetical protein